MSEVSCHSDFLGKKRLYCHLPAWYPSYYNIYLPGKICPLVKEWPGSYRVNTTLWSDLKTILQKKISCLVLKFCSKVHDWVCHGSYCQNVFWIFIILFVDPGHSHVHILPRSYLVAVCIGQYSGALVIKLPWIRICEGSGINVIFISYCIPRTVQGKS